MCCGGAEPAGSLMCIEYVSSTLCCVGKCIMKSAECELECMCLGWGGYCVCVVGGGGCACMDLGGSKVQHDPLIFFGMRRIILFCLTYLGSTGRMKC